MFHLKFHKLYKDGERMFKPSMEKIAQNTIGKKYISVVTDAETADVDADAVVVQVVGVARLVAK